MTSPREDMAELECNGVTLDAWTSYSADSDLFTPVDQCHLGIGVGTSSMRTLRSNIERIKKAVGTSQEVKLWITSNGKRALQGVYPIDGHEIENDTDSGTQFSVSLRDRAQFLLSAADPKLYANGDTLVSVARKALKPWAMEVTADHVAARDLRQASITKDKYARIQKKARQLGLPPKLMSEKIAISIERGTMTYEDVLTAHREDLRNKQLGQRVYYTGDNGQKFGGVQLGTPGLITDVSGGISSLQVYQMKVQDIRPQGGESIWDFLNRHAERNGLLMSVTPEGKLLFCGLNYTQSPSYRFVRRIERPTENNIISGGERVDFSNVYSDVVVYGRAKGKDKTRSAFRGAANTPEGQFGHLGFQRTHAVRDNSIRSKEDAQHRAEYELAKSLQGARVFECVVPGHSQNGVFYAPDTVAEIMDDVSGIYENWYVTSRTFTRADKQGPRTRLRMVPLNSIVLAKDAGGG